MKMYCIGKVSKMVFEYNITDKRNHDKFKASVLDLTIKMYNEQHCRVYKSIDEVINSLMDNFFNDAYLVLTNKISLDEIRSIWSNKRSILLYS